MTEGILNKAKKAWLERFEGASLVEKVTLAHPTFKRLFTRTFYLTARNLVYIQIFSRMALSDQGTDDVVRHLNNRIDGTERLIAEKRREAELALSSVGSTQSASYGMPETTEVRITTPLSRRHLMLIKEADDIMRLVDTAWLLCAIDDRQQSMAQLELKRALRGLWQSTNSMAQSLRKRIEPEAPSAPKAEKPEEPETPANPPSSEPSSHPMDNNSTNAPSPNPSPTAQAILNRAFP